MCQLPATCNLQQGIALIAIDIVTARAGNLHAELVAALGLANVANNPRELYAAAYRTQSFPPNSRVETWHHPLTLGGDLPTLPLWLDEDLAIPLDLDETYRAACDTLRIMS